MHPAANNPASLTFPHRSSKSTSQASSVANMCGIHAWVSSSSSSCHYCCCCHNGAAADNTQQEADAVEVNDNSWLRRRGPDGMGTVTLDYCCAAGVVAGEKEDREEEEEEEQKNTQIYLTASVLQMRREFQPQPIALSLSSSSMIGMVENNTNETAADRNKNESLGSSTTNNASSSAYLAWNGEIYEVEEEDEDEPAMESSSSSVHDNDSLYVARRLTKAFEGSTTGGGAAAAGDDSDDKEQQQQRITNRIVQTLTSLTNAEYALCIVTAQSIYYARDPWGRRSLLVMMSNKNNNNTGGGGTAQSSEPDNNDEKIDNNKTGCDCSAAGRCCSRKLFQVASVATTTNHCPGYRTASCWTEVPPGILYEYRVATHEIIMATPFSAAGRRILLGIAAAAPVLSSTPPTPPPLSSLGADDDKNNDKDAAIAAALQLQYWLDRAVARRLRGHDSCAILFSGGLDSTVIAALALKYCPGPVTLVTVSFVVDDSDNHDDADADAAAAAANAVEAADAMTARASYEELLQLFPQRDDSLTWRHQVVPHRDVEKSHQRIKSLIYPKDTVMDYNIATALWFAAAAAAASSSHNDRLLLSGLGADELLGGYRRHGRAASEVMRDQDRLWERNLGRDDRVLSDHGTEVRFPYLDTDVVNYCRSHQDALLRHNLVMGVDKAVLRNVAVNMGLTTAATATKRAIQFGSRIAHVCDTKRFGSRRKATGTAITTTTTTTAATTTTTTTTSSS